MDKKVIAAVEIADHEVRLLVGQFFNGRLNILKSERVSHHGISNSRLTNSEAVVDSIRRAVDNAAANLGTTIHSVLMCVPSYGLTRATHQYSVKTDGRVSAQDIVNVYQRMHDVSVDADKILVNVLMNRYIINGISSRKVPINERCETLTVEADCYFCDQSVIFDYVMCVERAGLKIIDIVIDDIGFAKEASLFEASINQPIVGITCERQTVRLSLFHNGRLLSSEIKNYGFDMFLHKIKTTYKLSDDAVERLLYYNVDVNDVSPITDPIFVWSTKTSSHSLNKKDLLDTVGPDIIRLIDELYDTCEPIYELGQPRFIFSGEASRIEGLAEMMKTISEFEATTFCSTTFGVKDPAFTSLIGCFYFYKDAELLRGSSMQSVDENEFMRKVIQIDSQKRHEVTSETSITKKLKNLFRD